MNKHLVETLRLLKEQFNIQEELPPEDSDEDELGVTSIPTEHPMLGELCDDELEEEQGNTTSAYAGGEGPQRTPYAFGKSKKKRNASEVYDDPVEESNKWFVKLENIYVRSQKKIDSLNELNSQNDLNEMNYQEFKSDDSQTSRQKINSSIKEINKRLSEVEQMIHHSQKFKNEIGADSGVFYSDTVKRFQKISERLMRISSKIREFNT